MTTETVNNQTQTEKLSDTQRDGSSQAGRILAALDPNYVSVDERSLKDILAFAREYAKELRYFEVKNEQVQATGDWRDFLNDQLDLDEVLEFIQHPENFSAERAQLYTRPHFALFLTFIQLLQQAQSQLNSLTRRHLDFYYKEVLQATKKPGIPDQVNVLLELAPNTEPTLLPAETRLNAGTDSLGQDLFYSTDNDIVINHAQIAKLSSVYVEKRITGIREARESHKGTKQERIMQMLQMALGDPLPSDSLPLFKVKVVDNDDETGDTVDYDYLHALQQLVNFVQTDLFMDFPDLRALMKLKSQRDNDNAEWKEINRLLEKAGKHRTNDSFQLDHESRDFKANLNLALGIPNNKVNKIDELFKGLREVKNIYELYEQRFRKDVQTFIQNELHFTVENDFYRMMQIKVRIDNEWQEIYRLLEKAAQKKEKRNTPYINLSTAPMDFAANFLNTALEPTYPSYGSATIEDL